jgi:hypothetical protein
MITIIGLTNGIEVISFPDTFQANNSYLEWHILAEIQPYKFHIDKYELKFQFKLLNSRTVEFVDINTGAEQKNLRQMFALGENYSL